MTLTRKSMQIENLENRQMLAGTPWGQQAKLLGQDLLAAQFPHLTGAGQTVVVIDQGVNYTHPVLAGKYAGGWDFAANDANPWADTNPHGTGVATAIAASGYDYQGQHYQGIAPGVKIMALRQTTSAGAAAALQWVIANKAKYNITAVNLTDWCTGGTAAIWKSEVASINTLAAMNVMVTMPAGNNGVGGVVPNYGGNEVAVGSTTAYGQIASTSTRGAGLDFLAPAHQITLPYWYGGAIYTTAATGTSFAAPQIAGAAAVLRQINPGFTNAQIKSIIADSGTKVYDSSKGMTYPLLNIYNAVKLAYQRIGQAVPAPAPTPAPAPAPAPAPQAPAGTTTSTATPLVSGTVIQAEDFNAGKNGVAYRELDPANFGGVNYRPGTGVDIFAINDGGSTRAVGGNRAGEWLNYTVNVKTAGTYTVEFRVASKGDGGKFHLSVDGKNVTGPISAGNSGSWTGYTSVYKTVALTAGQHTLTLGFDSIGGSGGIANFNYMKFTLGNVVPATPAAATTSPFSTVSLSPGIAAVLQAENFDNGARGVAWADTDTINSGGKYRTNTGVDIDTTTDVGGGHMVGATRAGEWMNYTVNVAKAGTFTFDVRQAMASTGGSFHIEVDGKNVTGAMAFKNTGNWKTWGNVTKSGISLTAGKHTIRVVIDSVSRVGIGANINWIKIV